MARGARLEVGLEEVSQVVRRELARVEVVVDHLPCQSGGASSMWEEARADASREGEVEVRLPSPHPTIATPYHHTTAAAAIY